LIGDIFGMNLVGRSLRAFDHRFRRFAEHGGDDRLELTDRRRDIFRYALAVAQNHEVVGNVQQFLEEMTDINNADAGIAQAADDVVQPLHFRDMQRRGRLVENENARILQHGARDLDQLPVRQAQAIKRRIERHLHA
jgi:hypothetical protein